MPAVLSWQKDGNPPTPLLAITLKSIGNKEKTKKNYLSKVIAVLIFLPLCGNALGEELNLICTGKEGFNLDIPYAFKATFDLEKNKFNLEMIKENINKHNNYPRDSPWDAQKCPAPVWKLEVTDTNLRVISTCSQGSDIFQIWDLSRTDGLFTVFLGKTKIRGSGVCVKASEKAF